MSERTDDHTADGKPALGPLAKLAIEVGPLVVFFVVNARTEIFTATAAFMAATAVALAASWLIARKIPAMPLISGVFVLGFGGLTLLLDDELFIKLKPTIVNLLFATILAGGLLGNKLLLKIVLGETLVMADHAWRVLTWRWAGFFVVLAVINEVVWRTQTTDFWVSFKLFGIMPLTIAFALSQLPFLKRHMIEDGTKPED